MSLMMVNNRLSSDFLSSTGISTKAQSYLPRLTLCSPRQHNTLRTASALAIILLGATTDIAFAQDDNPKNSDGTIGTVKIKDDKKNTVGANVGVNGSSDFGATEGSDSLTADTSTMMSKTPLKLRETPQSVTVITNQRLEDQQLTDITKVLDQTPGITTVYTNSQLNPTYYSRGFAINSFQIDGGQPITYGFDGNGLSPTSPFRPTFDLSQYDRIEVLRGSDGVNVGTGAPGGVVSLQRKRPVAGTQVLMDVVAGSYEKKRGVFDVSTPLFDTEMLRLRVVGSRDNSKYFFNDAYLNKDSVYANLEFDPFDTTQINIGATYDNQQALPFNNGLPRASDGSDLRLPRSTFLSAPWSIATANGMTYFARLQHEIARDWNLSTNLNVVDQNTFSNSAFVSASGFPAGVNSNGTGTRVQGGRSSAHTQAYTADTHINGAFDILGHRQTLTIGGAYSLQNYTPGAIGAATYSFTSISNPQGSSRINNFFTFDPHSIPQPSQSNINPNPDTTLSTMSYQYAGYAELRLSPWDPLHVIVSDRYTYYGYENNTRFSFPGSDPFDVINQGHASVLPQPNINVTYDIFPNTMTIYAGRNSIFTTNPQNFTVQGAIVPPVTGDTYEVGLKRSDFNGTLNTSIAFYKSHQVNLPTLDPRFPPGSPETITRIGCCFLPGGDTNDSQGIDVEMSGAVMPELQIQTGYTYNQNQFTPGPDTQFANVRPLISLQPRHLFKLFATYRPSSGPLRDATFGFGTRAQSTTFAAGSVCNLQFRCTSFNFTQDPYALFDIFMKYDFSKNLSAQLNITNIFDKTYYATVGTPAGSNFYGQPRAFTLAIHATF